MRELQTRTNGINFNSPKKEFYQMTKKVYRVRNWKEYNKGLVQRGSLTFWFSNEVIEGWRSKKSKDTHGNQKYSSMVILCGLTLRQLYRLPLRATEGMLRSLIELMDLKLDVPDYSTLSRRGKNLKDFDNQQTDLLIRCFIINQINKMGLPKSVVIN